MTRRRPGIGLFIGTIVLFVAVVVRGGAMGGVPGRAR